MLRAADAGRPVPINSLQELAAEAVARQIQQASGAVSGVPNTELQRQADRDPGVADVLKASRVRAVKRSRNASETRRNEAAWQSRAQDMLHPPWPALGSIPENYYHDMRYMLEDDHGMAKHMAWRDVDAGVDPLVAFVTREEFNGRLTEAQELNPQFIRFVRQRLSLTEAELPDDAWMVSPTERVAQVYNLPLKTAAVATQELHADFMAGQAP